MCYLAIVGLIIGSVPRFVFYTLMYVHVRAVRANISALWIQIGRCLRERRTTSTIVKKKEVIFAVDSPCRKA